MDAGNCSLSLPGAVGAMASGMKSLNLEFGADVSTGDTGPTGFPFFIVRYTGELTFVDADTGKPPTNPQPVDMDVDLHYGIRLCGPSVGATTVQVALKDRLGDCILAHRSVIDEL